MKSELRKKGSILVVSIFVVTMLSTLVGGMLLMSTEEIHIMEHKIYAAQALAIAQAGLNDAFSEIRSDPNWGTGFTDKVFEDGTYTVDVNGTNLTAVGVENSWTNYSAKVEVDITIGPDSPYVIRIDDIKVNKQ